jgi:hypothetical protein
VQAEPAMGPGAAACQYFTRKRTGSGARMKIRVGFEMIYDFPQPTPVIMVIGTHFTRASDIIVPDHLYQRFRDKQDGVIKVVLRPGMN